jgi:8-oxo-dGTP pyrophosphatase MutT (NUDIX family)
MGKKSKLRELAARLGSLEQVAALPYRFGEQGLEFLVITSRRTKRLIVPKGWPMPGKTDASAAAIEANEEAGVKGWVSEEPCGSFEYLKAIDDDPIRISTAVYPLHVRKVKTHYKERKQRKRKWLCADDAATRLADQQLRVLVRSYASVLIAANSIAPEPLESSDRERRSF